MTRWLALVAVIVAVAIHAVEASEWDDQKKYITGPPKIVVTADVRDPLYDRKWEPFSGAAIVKKKPPVEKVVREPHWTWANVAAPAPELKKPRGADPVRVMANVITESKPAPPSKPDYVRAHDVTSAKPRRVAHRSEKVVADAHITPDEPRRKRHRRSNRVVANAHVSWDEPRGKRGRRRPSNRVAANAHASWDEPKPAIKKAAAKAERVVAYNVTPQPGPAAPKPAKVPRQIVSADRAFPRDEDAAESRRAKKKRAEPQLVSADVRFPRDN